MEVLFLILALLGAVSALGWLFRPHHYPIYDDYHPSYYRRGYYGPDYGSHHYFWYRRERSRRIMATLVFCIALVVLFIFADLKGDVSSEKNQQYMEGVKSEILLDI